MNLYLGTSSAGLLYFNLIFFVQKFVHFIFGHVVHTDLTV